VTAGPWLEELAVVCGVFLLAGLVAWLAYRYAAGLLEVRRERERTLREALARMDSPERIAAFLGSPEGRALLGEAPLAARVRTTRVALQGGAAFAGALGLALLAVAGRHADAADPGAVSGREDAFFWGVILLALSAAAFYLSVAVRALAAPVPQVGEGRRPGGDG
jgi:hypothetical protein